MNDTNDCRIRKLEFAELKRMMVEELAKQLYRLRIPFFVLALFLFCNKFVPLWVFLLFSYFAAAALFRYLPERVKTRLTDWSKCWSLKHFHELMALKDLKEGARCMKPFLFTALFFAAAPISVCVMLVHYVRRLLKGQRAQEPIVAEDSASVIFRQNLLKQKDEDTSFFHSPAFALTTFGVIGLGLPVAVIVLLYTTLGIERVLNETSRNSKLSPAYQSQKRAAQMKKQFEKVSREVVKSHKVRGARRFTAADLRISPMRKACLPSPVNPDAVNLMHFAMYAYLMSMAWCIAILFMRAYFTFPLNFYSTEYDIELDQAGIRKHPIKGWFAEFMWYFWPDYLSRYYSWDEVRRVEYVQGGFGRLSPLPAVLFSKESILYKALNRLASATDALVDRIGRTEFISFDYNTDATSAASRISVRLWELNSDDKARLFYAIRTYAPHLYIDEKVQEKLIGSPIMKETRYTEIWFDLLTSNQDRKRQTSLTPGDTLSGGKYTIVEKLGAGGQAAVFRAKTEGGDQVVLKEFILASADTFGALVESTADFENESSTSSRLDHPGVVKFLNMFAEDKRAYIVLEHVSGRNLRQAVAESGPAAEKDVLELAIQMCDVLGYLHGQSPPVVHRDFTPENLIQQNDGSVKVVDFSVSSRTGPHKAGDCVGKHSYTPPEQFRWQACPQSDIYAMGATLYFLLTGEDPKAITMSDPRSKNSSVSEDLAAIVLKCTALNLSERFESVSWLRLDLEAIRTKSKAAVAKEIEQKPVPGAAVIKLDSGRNDVVSIKIPKNKKQEIKRKPRKSKKRSSRQTG